MVVTAVAMFLLVGFILGLVFGIRTSTDSTPEPRVPDVLFSYGDTRIVSFGSFFCDEITLVEIELSRTTVNLYLITDTPPLTVQNNFTIISSLTSTRYWRYYLYPNSNFTTLVRGSGSVTFYLIKGRSNFQQYNPLEPSTIKALTSFSTPCSLQFSHQFSFKVQAEDEYYFVYHNNNLSCVYPFRLNVTISISLFQYSTLDLATAPKCTSFVESVH